MLLTLRIKNLALVSELTLTLHPGFNALTGETGAGKSILIGGLSLLLGERADRTLIRSGADQTSVEGVFDIRKIRGTIASFLEHNGIELCEADQLFLKRTLSSSGANRQFINGSPVPLTSLETLGAWLVDIHGPHDHQSLFHPAKQLELLDAFGNLMPHREKFSGLLAHQNRLQKEKSNLIVDENIYLQQLDLLRFQVSEITRARLSAEEETELETEHRRSANAARLIELSQTALAQLADDENSIEGMAGKLGRTLQELARIDPAASCLLSLHQQSIDALRDLQSDLRGYHEKLDLDPERFTRVEERLNLLQDLKRKYGRTLGDVIHAGEEASRKLTQLEARDAELQRINRELEGSNKEIISLGQRISDQRREVIPRLDRAVQKELAELGFKQSRFEVQLSSVPSGGEGGDKISARGFDTIEFLFSPNPGEPMLPLRAIASSGEIARVMLGLKTVLAREDEIPVLVFDEVDANIGGETATTVGEKMRQIGGQRQVLCITHLPSVAAKAETHYRVVKNVEGGRTVTTIELLEGASRVEELARMVGGQMDTARQHAEALLAKPALRRSKS